MHFVTAALAVPVAPTAATAIRAPHTSTRCHQDLPGIAMSFPRPLLTCRTSSGDFAVDGVGDPFLHEQVSRPTAEPEIPLPFVLRAALAALIRPGPTTSDVTLRPAPNRDLHRLRDIPTQEVHRPREVGGDGRRLLIADDQRNQDVVPLA